MAESSFLPKNVSQTEPLQSPERVSVDSSYQGLLDANPYKNYEYYESPWQSFLSGLGFRTEADAYRENMQIQAAEYDSQIKLMNWQNMYNSEAAKAARMRASGQNPDLLGTGDVSESAAPPEDGNPPMASSGDAEKVMQVANGVMQCFTTAVGISKDLGALTSITLGNESTRMKNAEDYLNLSREIITNVAKRKDFDDPKSFHSKLYAEADSIARSHFRYGSRRYNRFITAMEHSFEGVPTEKALFESWLGDMNARQSAYEKRQSSDYSDSHEVLKGIARVLGQWKLDQRKYEAEGAEEKAYNELEYAQNFDALGAATAANAENYAREATADVRKNYAENIKLIDQIYDKMTKEIKSMSDNGNVVASCFLALFSILRLQFLKI